MGRLPALNFPEYQFRLRKGEEFYEVWDPLRGQWLVLTPEEWVRQHFIAYLVGGKGYPVGRIGNEISLILNGRSRRCDTLIYDAEGQPLVLIEYKAPHIAVSQKVFEQAIRYNICFRVPYIILSNGMSHYCCHVDYDTGEFRFLTEIPPYNEL